MLHFKYLSVGVVCRKARTQEAKPKCRPERHHLQVLSWKTPPTGFKLKDTTYRFEAGRHHLQISSWKTAPTDFKLEDNTYRF